MVRCTWPVAALVWCVALLVSACGGGDATDLPTPNDVPQISDAADRGLSPSVEEVRELEGGADVVDDRPAACRMTLAVLIVDGRPRPASLTVRAGDCVVWGNEGRIEVSVQSTGRLPRISKGRATGAIFGFAFTMKPQSAGRSIGPFMSVTARRAFEQVATKRDSKGRGEAAPEYVPFAYASTKGPVTVRYAVRQTGATGSLILKPAASGRSSVPRERFSAAVERVRALRGGVRVLNERPAACLTTHAIRFIDGRPQPAKLVVPPGACVVWGNHGDVVIDVESRKECTGYRRCIMFSHPVQQRSAEGTTGPLKRGLGEIPYRATLRSPSAQEHADERSRRVARGTITVD